MASYPKSARTKQQIFETAQKLFLEKGYTATSLNDIAQAAGISRGTLYNHYPTKGDLLVETQELVAQRLASFAETIPPNLPVDERICMLASEDLRGISHGFPRKAIPDDSPQIDYALAGMSEPFASVARLREEHSTRRVLRDIYKGILNDAVSTGELQKDTDTKTLAQVFLALYFHELEFVILDPAWDFEKSYLQKVRLVLNGSLA